MNAAKTFVTIAASMLAKGAALGEWSDKKSPVEKPEPV